MTRPGFFGQNLRIARALRGLSQAEVGESIGVTHTFVGQLEAGTRRPTPLVVAALGEVLGFGPAFFEVPLDDEVHDEECHFRRRSALSSTAKGRLLAHGTLLSELRARLGAALGLPSPAPLFGARDENGDLEGAAESCRRALGSDPEGPLGDLTQAIERAGVLVASLPSDTPGGQTFARSGLRPMILVYSAGASASRARLDLAAELAHLVLPDVFPPDHWVEEQGRLGAGAPNRGSGSEMEERAQAFAMALLLPAGPVRRELSETAAGDWDALFRLKARYGASVATLLRRGYDLGVIDAARYQRAYRQMSSRGWIKAEPQEPAVEAPRLLADSFVALASVGFSPTDVARRLAWSPLVFERVSGVTVPGAPVVSLASRRALSSPEKREPTQLSLFE